MNKTINNTINKTINTGPKRLGKTINLNEMYSTKTFPFPHITIRVRVKNRASSGNSVDMLIQIYYPDYISLEATRVGYQG